MRSTDKFHCSYLQYLFCIILTFAKRLVKDPYFGLLCQSMNYNPSAGEVGTLNYSSVDAKATK